MKFEKPSPLPIGISLGSKYLFQDLVFKYVEPDIIRVIKSKRLGLEGHLSKMGESKFPFKNLTEKVQENTLNYTRTIGLTFYTKCVTETKETNFSGS